MQRQLKEQIERLRLDDKVVVPGRIPHERMPGIYALVDVLVYPRHSARVTEMITPLKPMEAMAMGRAVVASDVGGHKELIHHGETGLLFASGNVNSLVETLERVLNNCNLRRMLEVNGTAWVRRTRTWDSTTAAYETVYANALGDACARKFGLR